MRYGKIKRNDPDFGGIIRLGYRVSSYVSRKFSVVDIIDLGKHLLDRVAVVKVDVAVGH